MESGTFFSAGATCSASILFGPASLLVRSLPRANMEISKTRRTWPARLLQRTIEVVIVLVILDLITGVVSMIVLTRIGNPIDWKSRRLAGKYAIDCGHVPIRADSKTATNCALKAQADGNAFRVIYEASGIDNRYSVGIVRAPDGQVYELFYSLEMPGIGSSILLKSVRVRSCPTPTHLFANPIGQADCFEWR